ncbi:MAG: dTDP-glucose 4,6-dehydratase, partial [Thermoplasmata archaeon]
AASLDRIKFLHRAESRVDFLLHDLRAPLTDHLIRQIEDHSLDVVVHAAAETHVDRSLVDPEPFVHSNVLGTYHLLEYCRLHQARLRMFVYVSTDEVYGPAEVGVDHPEGAPHKPSSPYAASKAAAEDLCFAYEHAMGVPVLITNTMNNIGEMQDPEKYVPKIIRALFRGEIITVHGSPDAPGSRKYLYARDHADAVWFLLTFGRRGERYNVVGGEEIDNLDMVRRLERITAREAKIKFVDFHATRPGHDRRYSLDGGKMAELGWTPPTPINQALGRIVEFAATHPEWRE